MALSQQTLNIWQRLISEQWTDAWLERVAWAGPENCVISTFPGGKTARLQVYGQTEKRCRELVKNYGGKLIKTKANAWIQAASQPIVLPFPPDLCVVSAGEVPRLGSKKKLPRLLIPAGMAFGTGDHATTGMCMRQLLSRCRGERKRILDLGTGSGILALAAAMLGHEVQAMDFDPESIRTAKENAKRNGLAGKVSWHCADVKRWQPEGKGWDLITANLFSSLLQAALPRMKRWLRPGGEMVLSGVLKSQSAEVEQTLRKLDLGVRQILKKGKWVCFVVEKKAVSR
jgi:ribosomal protein L11 methyltransferase